MDDSPRSETSCVDELAGAWPLLDENGAVRQRAVAKTAGIDGLLRLLVKETEQPTVLALPAL